MTSSLSANGDRTEEAGVILWTVQFLGAFANFRNATISYFMSVRKSAWNNSALTGRIFIKFDI
jgi:hypothetical protein